MSAQILHWISLLLPLLVLELGSYASFHHRAVPNEKLWLPLAAAGISYVFLLALRCPTGIALLGAVCIASLTGPEQLSAPYRLDLMTFWTLPAAAFGLASSQWWMALLLLAAWSGIRWFETSKLYSRFGQVTCLCGIVLCLVSPLPVVYVQILGVLLFAVSFGLTYLHKPARPALLFDLDGTLIDSQPLVFETFRRVFAKAKPGYPLSEKELYSFFGPTLEVTFSKYFPPDQVGEIIDLYQQINLDLHEKYLKEMPHASEVIEQLHNEGYKMAIVSNKRRYPVELGLKLSGLAPYFDVVLGKEDLPRPKPEPEGLLAGAKALGVPADQAIYIGDNASDIQAAQNAGMYSVGYTQDELQKQAVAKQKPCTQIDDLRQLPELFKEDSLWIDKSIW